MDNINKELEELAESIIEDFKNRQQERKRYEANWQLNINFFIGNQYCAINNNNEVVDFEKQFFWQEREVYNHIAPILEQRLSKLAKVRPTMTVVPFSDSDQDINCAKVSKNILKATSYKLNLSRIISEATVWSELCGTVFYKVTWNNNLGTTLGIDNEGNSIHEGDVQIDVVSPFEIFPDSSTYSNIDDCKSIMQARVYNVDTIKDMWGIDVEGKDLDVFTLDSVNLAGGLGYYGKVNKAGKTVKHNSALVIEKYEMPTIDYPNGRLIIVADKKVVYIGELPYINKSENKRGFPFISQCSIQNPNCLWGGSVVERCIPIQRSYNAIKNRKHEFLNRISMGVMAVEDGSVDTDNLEEEGMAPGKVLIYRQGSPIPKLLSSGSVPSDFAYEEDRLLNEFLTVSGVSDLLRNSSLTTNLSGVALELLIEQDEARLISSAEEIRQAVKEISKHILRLYKQFINGKTSSKLISNNGNIEMFYWNKSDINSDDVVFETENELNESLAQKRNMIFEIFNSGLLHDENGKLNNSVRYKLLEQLGLGIWENTQDIKTLQIKRADKENLQLLDAHNIDVPREIDNHDLHINEHTCFMLSDEFEKASKRNPNLEKLMLEHIRQHKQFRQITNEKENDNG